MMKFFLAASVSTCAAVGAADAATLLSHFTFDSDASNAVSASLDGTLNNGALIDNTTAAVGGGAAYFDGVDDFVNAGTNAVPGVGGAFYSGSIALWLKTDTSNGPANTNGAKIMGMQNGNPATFGADDRMAFLLESSSSGNMRNFVRADNSVSSSNNRIRFTDGETGTAWANGDWTHYVFTWEVDASANLTSQIYVNGAAVATTNNETGLESDPALSPLNPWDSPGMYIGAFNNRINQGGSAVANFNGWLDDIRIYDGALTQAEVLALPGVPEPASFVLLGAGGLALLRRRSA